MTSFFAIAHYSPFIVLAIGLTTFAGLWGLGTVLIHLLRLDLPPPWIHVTAILLGIQVESLTVQIFGMIGLATRPLLIGIWSLMILCAAIALYRWPPNKPSAHIVKLRWLAVLTIAVVVIAIGVNLLIAVAPSTKIDELFYHMLVPSRIVSDGALRFYREPWESAIWPQMVYQISAAPLHAMGYPDAANVVSWSLAGTLLWLAWRLMRANERSTAWAMLWLGSICVGMYAAVWDVTGGAHAMGDLAMASAVVAFCVRERQLAGLSPFAYAAMLSILLVGTAASKVTLLPVSGLLLCFAAWRLFRSMPLPDFAKVVLILVAPWIIFLFPLAIWCWSQSGSPFGLILANKLGPSIYPMGLSEQTFAATRAAVNWSFMTVIEFTAINYSPLVWLGVIGAFVGTSLSAATRGILLFLLMLQCSIIYVFLAHDVRYLGGFHYGLVVAFGLFAAPGLYKRLASLRYISAVCLLLLLPWLGVQVYYAKQFFPVALGLEKLAFYKRYVAVYADYVNLDRLLPSDAVILVRGFLLDSVYAPRPIFYDEADLPAGKPAVLFASLPERVPLKGYKLGRLIYTDKQAVVATYRTPGKSPTIGPISVVALVKAE